MKSWASSMSSTAGGYSRCSTASALRQRSCWGQALSLGRGTVGANRIHTVALPPSRDHPWRRGDQDGLPQVALWQAMTR